MTFLLQYWRVDWKRSGPPVFFGSSMASAVMLLVMSRTTNVFVAYAMYLSTSSMYHILIAVASNIIASQLNSASYSLIFGFNTFLALLFQSVLTFTVADERGLALDIRTQFIVYSGYFFVIAVVFCVPLLAKFLCKRPNASDS
ncbi:reduced folate carrier [Aphelenchoides avenae]|nr:reduced folate carrier [Aphelenchus avenae]